ncbi:hypothetical protein NQ318_018961 [Aromia moschata]|uniref:Uncharacterized protein n=1 Tax=Aromia moschata TaxID=1265417 RepID=A0AAV8ZGY8_9CUCU|nr:hypothetical protein NQ318_018961 [Aromia moschata]
MGWKKWFRYHTSLEKRLIVFVAVLSVFVLVLFVCLLSSAHGFESVEAVKAKATEVLNQLTEADFQQCFQQWKSLIERCRDRQGEYIEGEKVATVVWILVRIFYNFACGSFLKNAFSLGHFSTLSHLKELMKNQLKEVVVEKTNKRNMSRMLSMQRTFYKACMDETEIENDENRSFLKHLDEIVGGWPVVKLYRWVERDFDWVQAMLKARRLGFFYEFYFRVDIHMKDNGSLWIRPPSRSDLASFHWRDENLDAIAKIATVMGSKSLDTLTHLRRTIYFAERLDELIKTYDDAVAHRNENKIKKIAVKSIDHVFIKLPWIGVLKNITGLKVREDDMVVFDVNDYFRDLYYLLMQTPKKIQANYIAWTAISTNADYLTKNVRDIYRDIQRSANDTKANLSRQDVCYRNSVGLFKNVAEGEYVRRYTPLDKRKRIREMITNIKQQLETDIEDNSWMDKETKDFAVRYIRNVSEAIGWTDVVYNAGKFERLFGYHKVNFPSTNLIEMARVLSNHGVNRYYKQLTYTDSEMEEQYLNTPQLDINAYYLQYFNKIVLPTPILQGFLYDEKRPNYMNYGALGSIIGHEFTHALTKNAMGNGGEDGPWWTNRTVENFRKATQCLVDEYNAYPYHLEEFNKNGTATLEENVADFIGRQLAYTGYQNWVRHNYHEDSLPGVKLTPNQIFWIMTSTYLCTEPKISETQKRRNKSTHGVPSFRTLSHVRNSPYFGKDFNCPVGSKMNPEKKCLIFT